MHSENTPQTDRTAAETEAEAEALDRALARAFASARSPDAPPSTALLERVLADAADALPRRADPVPVGSSPRAARPGWLTRIFLPTAPAGPGGWQGVLALGLVAVTGLALGYGDPGMVASTTAVRLFGSATDIQLDASTPFAEVESISALLTEG